MQNKTQFANYKSRVTSEEVEITQLIVFNLGKEEYGAEINQVSEIVRVGLIRPIPGSADFIQGVTNIRGEITLVINLKARFLIPAKEETKGKHIVITEQKKNLFGLMVDEVTEVLRIPKNDIKATPELIIKIDNTYISGVITLENRLIILLDLTKVLSEKELAKMAEVSQNLPPPKSTEEETDIRAPINSQQ